MKKNNFLPKIIDLENDVTLLHDNELEKVVIGAILLEPNCLDELGGLFTEKLFYNDANKTIARAILDLFISNEKVDLITITIKLRQMEQLDLVGGAYYVASLTNKVTGSTNIEYHVRILQQFSLARQINEICNKSKYKLFNGNNDVFDVYEELQVSLENSLKDISKFQVNTLNNVFTELITKSRAAIETGGTFGVPTGLHSLDEKTNGWQGSDLIIIAGRPGMGKTAMAISIMLKPAIDNKIPLAFFSLEMSSEQLVGRMASAISGISASKIIKKQLNKDELQQMESNSGFLKDTPIYLDDTPNISLVELKTKARKLVRENGVRAIIIDYLQLMRSGLQISNREQEISEISRGLKALAKELNIPVIALSQLSRMVESRSDKKPMLSDLRESGQIEQDADLVLFTYRPTYYGIDEYELSNGKDTQTYPTKTENEDLFVCIIAKHRNGGIGEVVLSFIPKQTRVVNYGITGNTTTNQHNTNVENNIFQHNTNVENNSVNSQNITLKHSTIIEPNKDFLNEKGNSINNTNIEELPF